MPPSEIVLLYLWLIGKLYGWSPQFLWGNKFELSLSFLILVLSLCSDQWTAWWMLGTALQTKVTPIVEGYGGWKLCQSNQLTLDLVNLLYVWSGNSSFTFYFIPFKMVDEFIGFYDFWKGWGWFYQTIAYFMTTYLEAQMLLLFSQNFPSSSLFQRPKHAVKMLYVLDFCRILRLTLLSQKHWNRF
jgi:hypothetical protein